MHAEFERRRNNSGQGRAVISMSIVGSLHSFKHIPLAGFVAVTEKKEGGGGGREECAKRREREKIKLFNFRLAFALLYL
jgi:hypothetical protein